VGRDIKTGDISIKPQIALAREKFNTECCVIASLQNELRTQVAEKVRVEQLQTMAMADNNIGKIDKTHPPSHGSLRFEHGFRLSFNVFLLARRVKKCLGDDSVLLDLPKTLPKMAPRLFRHTMTS
jgi:hypothetical protein